MAKFSTEKKTLDSGHELVLQTGGWEEVHRLYRAVAGVIGKYSFREGEALALLSGLETSPEVEAAVWPCMARSTYDGHSIKKDLFEEVEARADFLVIKKEVMVYNLAPFIKSLALYIPSAEALLGISKSQSSK